MPSEEWQEHRRQIEEQENTVHELLVKLLTDSSASGIEIIISALEDAARHYDNCCDPHTEADLLDVVDKLKK